MIPIIMESFQRSADLICRKHLLLVQMLQTADVKPVFSNPAVATVDDVYQDLAQPSRVARPAATFALAPATRRFALRHLQRGIQRDDHLKLSPRETDGSSYDSRSPAVHRHGASALGRARRPAHKKSRRTTTCASRSSKRAVSITSTTAPRPTSCASPPSPPRRKFCATWKPSSPAPTAKFTRPASRAAAFFLALVHAATSANLPPPPDRVRVLARAHAARRRIRRGRPLRRSRRKGNAPALRASPRQAQRARRRGAGRQGRTP